MIKKIIKQIVGENVIYSLRQYYNFLLTPSKKNTLNPLFELSKRRKEVFCGYYDKNMIHNGKLLFLESKKNVSKADICLYDIDSKSIKKINTTDAWNWQQGSRLMWLCQSSDYDYFFNTYDYKEQHFISKFACLDSGKERYIPWPLYDISSDSKFGLNLNFSRLNRMRPGYGYSKDVDVSDDNKNWINVCYLDSLEKHEIVTEEMILEILKNHNCKINDNKTYINHLSISPKSKFFIFFYITIIAGKHVSYLFRYSFEKKELQLLESNLIVSHYCWIDDDRILVTAYDSKWNCGYYIYENGSRYHVNDNLTKDGHPTYIGNNKIITDTYPDKRGMQSLFIAAIDQSNYVHEIGRIYHTSRRREEVRCDLHPKVNIEEGIIVLDTNSKQNRKILGVPLC